jgi:hypothetical protein
MNGVKTKTGAPKNCGNSRWPQPKSEEFQKSYKKIVQEGQEVLVERA